MDLIRVKRAKGGCSLWWWSGRGQGWGNMLCIECIHQHPLSDMRVLREMGVKHVCNL